MIATAATAISERVFGAGGRPPRGLAFGVPATAMAVAGPLTVLRRWLQRFGSGPCSPPPPTSPGTP